jgi:hypothetical protein
LETFEGSRSDDCRNDSGPPETAADAHAEEAFAAWWASDEAQCQLSHVDREAARVGWLAAWLASRSDRR